MSRVRPHPHRRSLGALAAVGVLVGTVAADAVRAASLAAEIEPASPASTHLVISELMTGGAGASDEFVEVYNPTGAALSLDGLELVYVTASGATITRKASWAAGTVIGAGAHQLVANEAGLFAGIADVIYAGGLSAAGGSLALRASGASTAIDAVGWGTAASSWLESVPAPAPAAGESLERLPGGELGSGQDTDHNLVDFALRAVPDPQNSGSPPVPVATPEPTGTPTPSAMPSIPPSDTPPPTPTVTPEPTAEPTPGPSVAPTPEPTPQPTPEPTPEPTPDPTLQPTPEPKLSPTPSPMTVAEARAVPDGSAVNVMGIAITDSDFSEGGGYLADTSGGIAVLLDGATFTRGELLVLRGMVDDRYAQRTIRADSAGITLVGAGVEPDPVPVDTGTIDEPLEGRLVTVSGVVTGSPSELSSGLAFEIDDGSGAARVLVGLATGIDTGAWLRGSTLRLVGVVGQRDSTGTGTEGYRVQPRDPTDIGSVVPPPTPTPEPSPTPTRSPTPTAAPPPPLVSVASARAAAAGTGLRIRGVVILPTGLLDASSAVVADPSGGILARLGSDAGALARGQLVELSGTRSTKSGMVSVRVAQPALVLGAQAEPAPAWRVTGSVGEAHEATLVVVRGVIHDGPRRSAAGGLSFTVNDGSGPLRVFVAPASRIPIDALPSGAWVELRGVVGQETTGAEPNSGYRLWPRDRADLRILARATEGGSRTPGARTGTAPTPSPPASPRAVPSLPAPGLSNPDPAADARPTASAAPRATGALSAVAGLPGRIPLPLAATLGGIAGMLALAWRHGTLRRLAAEVQHAVEGAQSRDQASGDEEGESYTPGP